MADSGSGSRPPGRRPTKKGGCQRGSRLAPSELLEAAVEVYWQDDFKWYKGRVTELKPDVRCPFSLLWTLNMASSTKQALPEQLLRVLRAGATPDTLRGW